MVFEDFFIRNLDAGSYRENFLISAIVSLFVIRIYLKLTNYPQIGTGELHIAHMLWGGLFMLLAIIILLSFLSKTAATFAAVLGGIGFGTFIDELGKFITQDNNYFYQPAVALIYIIIVLIYLLLKVIPRIRAVTQKEYLVNAVEMLKEAAINDFDVEEERRAMGYLNHCDPKDQVVKAVAQFLRRVDSFPVESQTLLTRFRMLLRNSYYTIAKQELIIKIIIFYLTAQAAYTFFTSFSLYAAHRNLLFFEWGEIYSSVLAALFVLLGLFSLRFSRIDAYKFFRIAVLVSVLLTQFFAFMSPQWIELIPLSINLFMLMIINYAFYMEKQKSRNKILNVPAVKLLVT